MDLEEVRDLLFKETFAATFEPATEDLPSDRVNVEFEVERIASPLQLQIIQIPEGANDQAAGVAMYQFYVPIPIEVSEAAADEVRLLLPTVNLVAPLMGFNLHETEGFVYFRYVLLTPASAAAGPTIARTVWLIYFTLDNLAADVAAVAAGLRTAAQVLDDE